MQETWVQSLGQEDPLEKGMATHPSTLAWRITGTKEPGKQQSRGLQRVRHNWATKHTCAHAHTHTHTHTRHSKHSCLLFAAENISNGYIDFHQSTGLGSLMWCSKTQIPEPEFLSLDLSSATNKLHDPASPPASLWVAVLVYKILTNSVLSFVWRTIPVHVLYCY